MIILEPGQTYHIHISLNPVPSLPSAITGTVKDSATGAAIQGATVEVIETGQSTTTDSNGTFTISNLPSGTPLTVRISAAGYETVEL